MTLQTTMGIVLDVVSVATLPTAAAIADHIAAEAVKLQSAAADAVAAVRRCSLSDSSKPVFKAPLVSAPFQRLKI